MSKYKIVIVGAGLGGLCLAQSLRRSGIDTEVYERDASPWDRPQGYRLHIDSDGMNALRDVLPAHLWALFAATSMRPRPFTTLVDTGLNEIKRLPSGGHEPLQTDGDGPAHVNVNRATLRQILLTDLAEICHFGATLERYESDADGVTAIFRDGRKVRADILVGADGVRSAVRRQRVPDARVVDTGVRAIYGRLAIGRAAELLPAQALSDVFTVASDTRKVFLGLGPVIFPTRPEVASAQLAPAAKLFAQDDYMVCIVGGRSEYFGDADLHRATSAELQQQAVTMLKEWPAVASAIPAHGQPASFFAVDMFTSVPCDLRNSGNVTLLGDAIHAMTPTLGKGANVAMRDAALLGRLLTLADSGELTLQEAMSAYEDEMTRYGFDIVRKSAATGERLMGQNSLPA